MPFKASSKLILCLFHCKLSFHRVPEQNVSRCAPADMRFVYGKVDMFRNGIEADPAQYTAVHIVQGVQLKSGPSTKP
jgi:hypothetical protein